MKSNSLHEFSFLRVYKGEELTLLTYTHDREKAAKLFGVSLSVMMIRGYKKEHTQYEVLRVNPHTVFCLIKHPKFLYQRRNEVMLLDVAEVLIDREIRKQQNARKQE